MCAKQVKGQRFFTEIRGDEDNAEHKNILKNKNTATNQQLNCIFVFKAKCGNCMVDMLN